MLVMYFAKISFWFVTCYVTFIKIYFNKQNSQFEWNFSISYKCLITIGLGKMKS